MYQNGIFQLWHKKSKSGKFYTAIVSVDRFGKLQFVFEETHMHLLMSIIKDKLNEKGYNFKSMYEIFILEEEFIYDIENDKILKKGENE